ncbi:hypothetical protein BWD42_24275 [Sphingobacterium sp. CZ-UAM]|uniref:right-handed parallel beta-helix repeat-containing protein n=1 Tax=Sphingobacterium sp. CZ-UAM TaxID=1933868 RepID=UPI000984E464|nr:right-handed parallel beta-helix repeat-containing protein [Sphingobacterium sp. CZ-UAM]OOG15670.1 hypothetical protein BWD42_24275 [Sphingobacterium sp. CZ-UAM]
MVLYNKGTAVLSTALIFFLVGLIFTLKRCSAQDIFKVDDYGAIADGKFDNTESINKCIVAALRVKNSKVVFGKGKYLCQGRVDINFKNDHNIIVQGNSETVIEFNNVDLDRGFLISGVKNHRTIGSIRLENFKIVGPQLGKGIHNRFYNTVRHLYGIGISNIKNVAISGIDVIRFYGNGIDVSNKLSRVDSSLYRFQNVNINNCKVLDTWGKSPTDSYGDGIYLADCNTFQIYKNIIKNCLEDNCSPGRGGIVIEDFTRNGIIKENVIVGYDRGIHIENSLGNIEIHHNSFIDNRIGVYLWSQGGDNERPISILSNEFSLKTILNNSKLQFSENNFMYIALLRQKELRERDKLFDNDFSLNSRIKNGRTAVNAGKFLSIQKNRFRTQ